MDYTRFPSPDPGMLDFHRSRSNLVLRRLNSTARHSIAITSSAELPPSPSGSQNQPEAPPSTTYPLLYTREMIACDVVDTLFLSGYLGRPTLHDFEQPPARVLDLGCGAGTWILTTAKSWPNTLFTGFDIRDDIAPQLDRLGDADLTRRVTWVQGDFLEPLDFPDASFDFVRVCKIGLAVREEKWPSIIDEIARVLAPGGVFEIIEENLHMPIPIVPALKALDSPSSPSSSSESPPNPDVDVDPRDHCALGALWDTMLAERGINAAPSRVLSLYIVAAGLHDLSSTPEPLSVQLPPPSSVVAPSRTPEHSQTPVGHRVVEVGGASGSEGADAMHVMRALATIRAARPALWDVASRGGMKPEDFESKFMLYERDMMDRAGLRGAIASLLGWGAPASPRDIDGNPIEDMWQREMKRWRAHEDLDAEPVRAKDNVELGVCRELKAFAAIKE